MRSVLAIVIIVFLVTAAIISCQAAEIRLQLDAKNAYYPNGYQGIEDVEITSASPDANTGGNWDLKLGTDDKGGIHRLLYRWNIKELAPLFNDPDKNILMVKMRIGEWYTRNKPNQQFGVYRILSANKDWVVGKTGTYTYETPEPGAVSWNQKVAGSQDWAGSAGCSTPGVDYDPEPVAIFHSDSNTSGMRPRYMPFFDLPVDLVRDWIEHPENNAGLLVKAIDETGDNLVMAIGSEHQRQDYGWHLHHPELVVTYMDKGILNMKAPGFVVRDGKPCVVVITPDNASYGEQHAAAELINHIKEISHADITQMSESLYKPEYGAFVSIGRTDASKKYVDDKKFAALGDEGYNTFTKDGNFYILGGIKRGSLYGVYDYLESAGVRWYSPTYTVIPRKMALRIPDKPVNFVPMFWYRDQLWNNQTTGEWRARMRLNGEYAYVPEDMGGSAHTIFGCHSFFVLIPPSEYFETNPEWFALKKDGKRSKEEYCLTNRELMDFVRDKVYKEVKDNKDWVEYIWVSQNDGSLSGCYCDECTAQRKAHGGEDRWSANIIPFVNYVADALKYEFPNVKVKTLAYSYTTEPPAGMKVADNITIELCGNFGPEQNDKQTKLARDWAKIAKNIQVYTYGGSNFGYWWPFPNIWEMGAQHIRAYDAGVTAFYVQGTAAGAGSGMVDLRAYLTARLSWDPTRDIQKEVKDFCDGYYGPASKYVYEYIRWYAAYTKRNNMKVVGGWGNADLWRGYVDKTAMRYCDSLFQRGMADVKDNPLYLKHLRRAYLEVIWGSIMVNLSDKPQIVDGNYVMATAEMAPVLKAKKDLFNEIMHENNFTVMSENVSYEAGRSQLDGVAANYPAVQLSNESCSMWIVPSLGGRVIIWNINKLGESIFRISGGSDPYSAGYEELGNLSFRNIKYEPTSTTDTTLSMKGEVNKNVGAVRTFTLDPDKPLLHIVSEYTNISDKPVTIKVRTHPEFAFKVFGKSKLYTVKSGKWSPQTLWSKDNREGNTYLDTAKIEPGIWMLGDTEKNIGLINRFDATDIETMYAYHGEDYGGVNLELWTGNVTLEPGETWKFEHSYEITTDLKKSMESVK